MRKLYFCILLLGCFQSVDSELVEDFLHYGKDAYGNPIGKKADKYLFKQNRKVKGLPVSDWLNYAKCKEYLRKACKRNGMIDFWKLVTKYGLFDQIYHIFTSNFYDIVHDSRPLLLRFFRILAVHKNKEDRKRLRGVQYRIMKRLGKNRDDPNYDRDNEYEVLGLDLAKTTQYAAEKGGVLDKQIRFKYIPTQKGELEYTLNRFEKLNKKSRKLAAEGEKMVKSQTDRYLKHLKKQYPNVDFDLNFHKKFNGGRDLIRNNGDWAPEGDIREGMVQIQACTSFLIKETPDGGHVVEIDSKTIDNVTPIEVGSEIEVKSRNGLIRGKILEIDLGNGSEGYGSVQVEMENGEVQWVPGNSIRLVGHDDAKLSRFDPDDLWFMMACILGFLAFCTTCLNVWLCMRGRTKGPRHHKPHLTRKMRRKLVMKLEQSRSRIASRKRRHRHHRH